MPDTNTFFSGLPFLIAVVSVADSELAVRTARALFEGGVRAIELTLRNDAALESIRKIREQVPQMIIGAGTVIEAAQVKKVIDAGAVFAVAPGMNEKIAEEAAARKIPFAPGIATPSDIERALGFGLTVLKVFPAKYLGGLPYIKSIHAPYAHLGLRFIPLGGLTFDDIDLYAKEKIILSLGGSWIVSKDDVENQKWEAITKSAAMAVESVKKAGAKI